MKGNLLTSQTTTPEGRTVYSTDVPIGRRPHDPNATGKPSDYGPTGPVPKGAKTGYKTLDEWLEGIRQRRAANPSKVEIQAALTAALQAGKSVAQAGEAMGINRQQFYQGKYKTTLDPKPED